MDSPEDPLDYYHSKRDPEINASTSLPDGESIRVPAIWVIEAFTPTLIYNLHIGAEKLGWTTSNSIINPDFTQTVSDMRSRSTAGGWLNLGYIRPLNSKHSIFSDRQAPLPTGISAISASIFQPFPSTTLLCCKFILDDDLAGSLEQPLRENYVSYKEPIGENRLQIQGVENQKKQAVEVMREYLHSLCTNWVSEHFPGYFSSELGGKNVPRCELVLFSKQDDFTELKASHANPHFLEMLDMDNSFDLWVSKELSNFYFKISDRGNQSQRRAVLFGNINKVLNNEDLRSYGETKESGVLNWLNYFDRTLGTWILDIIAEDFVAEMGRTRDKYGAVDVTESSKGTEKLRELDGRLLEFQRNAIPFAYDVTNYCKDKRFFMHDVFEFQSVKKWGDDYLQLFDGVKYRLTLYATHILDTEQQIRSIATQTGRMISANSNELLTTSNLRLQKAMFWMTIMMLFLTLIMAQQQIKELEAWLVPLLEMRL